MTIIDCVQGSPEWDRERCGLVTSSNFSLKMQPEKYMYQKAYERISGIPFNNGYTSKSIDRGNDWEDSNRARYELTTGLEVVQVGLVKHNDYISCSPDGLIGDDGGLELKSPDTITHMSYIAANKFPSNYTPQVQGNLWICERDWWDFGSGDDRWSIRPLFIKRVYRDEKYIEQLKTNVYIFVERMLELEQKLRGSNLTEQLERTIK